MSPILSGFGLSKKRLLAGEARRLESAVPPHESKGPLAQNLGSTCLQGAHPPNHGPMGRAPLHGHGHGLQLNMSRAFVKLAVAVDWSRLWMEVELVVSTPAAAFSAAAVTVVLSPLC